MTRSVFEDSRRAGLPWFVMALWLASTGTAHPDHPPATGLIRYAGTYDVSEFLNEPEIRKELQVIAGDELNHLQLNLNVTGPIDLISGWLTVSGNAPHRGTEEEAVVCMHPELQQVHAALLSNGKVTVLTRSTAYVQLPLCIKDWITEVESKHRNRLVQPSNVQLRNPPSTR